MIQKINVLNSCRFDLVEDLSAAGYVPYIGATTNIDLGAYDITATDGTFTGTGTFNKGIITTTATADTEITNKKFVDDAIAAIPTSIPTYIQDTDGNTKVQTEEGSNDNTIRFDTNGSQRMEINPTGQLGLGTTATTNYSLYIANNDNVTTPNNFAGIYSWVRSRRTTSWAFTALSFEANVWNTGLMMPTGINGVAQSTKTGGSTLASVTGANIVARQNSVVKTTELIGGKFKIDVRKSADVTTAIAVHANWYEYAFTGTITYAKGIKVDEPSTAGGTITNVWSIQSDGDVQINSDKKLILEGTSTVKGDTYIMYDSANVQMEFVVSGTDIVKIDAGGINILTGTLELTDTVWDDWQGALASNVKVNPSAHIVQDDTEASITFKTTCDTGDYIYMNPQMSHRWKLGTAIHPHLHWWQTTAAQPNWLVQYRWQRNGQAKTTVWTDCPLTVNTYTWSTGTLCQITDATTPITPPADYSLSDIIQFRVIRDVANDSGEFDGAESNSVDADALSFDYHFEIDTMGSREEYVK